MKILAPISTRTELAFSAVLALTCHAAAFGLIPEGTTTLPEVKLAAYKQNLEITLLPSQPPDRERVPEPVREKKMPVVRDEAPTPIHRNPIPKESVISKRTPQPLREHVSKTRDRRLRKDLPVRRDAMQPEERLLVIKKEGDDANQAITRNATYTVDSSRFDYPRFAREEGLEGRLLLNVYVSADGTAREVRLIRSSGHAILDRSATRQVKEKVRFMPALEQGRPIAMWVEVPISFSFLNASISVGNE